MNEILNAILDTISSIDPWLRTLLAALAVMLETSVLIGLVVPGDTIVIAAGTAVDSVPEAIILIVALVLGSLAGESIGFALGKWIGPKFKASRLGRKIGEKNWQRSEVFFLSKGGPAIFVSRFLPVLHSLVPLTVGMSGYRYRKFIAWTAPACLIWASLYVSISAVAAGTYRELSSRISGAGLIFVGIILVFIVLMYFLKRWLSSRSNSQIEEQIEESAQNVED